MDLKYIKELIQILEKSNLSKMTIKEKSGEEITIEKERGHDAGQGQVIRGHTPTLSHHAQEPLPTHKPPVNPEIDEKKCIKSPMIGTFYRAEGPDAKPFKNIGDEVKQGDVVCIIEAMKVMNEIKSSLNGKVTHILVDSGSPVEYGQKLFVIE